MNNAASAFDPNEHVVECAHAGGRAATIRSCAPGKVVLWGEYAVLTGAPAAVLAINRHAVCELSSGSAFRFISTGFAAPEAVLQHLPASAPKDHPAALLAWQVLQAFSAQGRRPATFRLASDAFFHDGVKLGIGASAALCTAIEGACAQRIGEPPSFARARDAHYRFQGGRGSGIDVAASFYGGALRYQYGAATSLATTAPQPNHHQSADTNHRTAPQAVTLPEARFLWTGESASTKHHLDRFKAYLQQGDHSALDALARCSEQLCDAPSLTNLTAYTQALHRLDHKADLGIYQPRHLQAERLAKRYNAVYKPCGAGGGDIGAVFAEPSANLAAFAANATAKGFTILNLEPAVHGLEIRA